MYLFTGVYMIQYTHTSRYYGIKEDQGIIQTDLIVLNLPFTETYVRNGEHRHPELLSQRIYGNPSYWWVICQYNGIVDPSTIWVGMKIRYPTITKAPREDI